MKRFIIVLIFLSIAAALSGCSNKHSIELTSSSVSIINDKSISGSIEITEGVKKGKKLVPTVLCYKFTIKNTGRKKVGGIGNKGLSLKIEPHDKLKNSLEDIIGFNVFNSDAYMNTGLGHGESTVPMLKRGEEGNYILTYDLGVSEESPNTKLITPSDEKLKEINDKALDASLIVICDGKEIARFDLNSK
ncbi:MAG: hypothetical protein QM697_07570 [Lachnospiraceae bacterium]